MISSFRHPGTCICFTASLLAHWDRWQATGCIISVDDTTHAFALRYRLQVGRLRPNAPLVPATTVGAAAATVGAAAATASPPRGLQWSEAVSSSDEEAAPPAGARAQPLSSQTSSSCRGQTLPARKPPVSAHEPSVSVPEPPQEEADMTACRQHMRALLESDFRGVTDRFMKERDRLTMPERRALVQQGRLPAEQCWGIHPTQRRQAGEARRQKDAHWEPPEMLDAASLIVRAVHAAIPTSVHEWLKSHPNSKTSDGQYRPMKRYLVLFERKHYVCIRFRDYHNHESHRQSPNRFADEPLHEYLPLTLAVKAVGDLLDEFRHRRRDFGPPFPWFETPEDDYLSWGHYAVRGVQEMLDLERGILTERQMRTGV